MCCIIITVIGAVNVKRRSTWVFPLERFAIIFAVLRRRGYPGRCPGLPSPAGLEALLFPAKEFPSNRPQPDWTAIHTQLARKGMTLERTWHTYRQAHPDGYSYGHFCKRYKDWSQKHKVSMRLHHKAGVELFVDYAGKTIELTDPETGEVSKAQIFVATLGCSNYTYVEATPDQKIRS